MSDLNLSYSAMNVEENPKASHLNRNPPPAASRCQVFGLFWVCRDAARCQRRTYPASRFLIDRGLSRQHEETKSWYVYRETRPAQPQSIVIRSLFLVTNLFPTPPGWSSPRRERAADELSAWERVLLGPVRDAGSGAK